MLNQPIIVFDSGIGGLSIYKPLRLALPGENIIYIADSQNFPYGDKTAGWLSNRFEDLCVHFAALNPKLVVLACNSATSNIIHEVRSALTCPVVGVEPVIKPLAKYETALALMTTVSANSATTAKLLKEYGSHVQVYTPKGLAVAIEYNDYDQVKKSLHEIKKIVQRNHIQAIGLSCTHYPLILHEFQKALPQIEFIDPSESVVKQILTVLKSE